MWCFIQIPCFMSIQWGKLLNQVRISSWCRVWRLFFAWGLHYSDTVRMIWCVTRKPQTLNPKCELIFLPEQPKKLHSFPVTEDSREISGRCRWSCHLRNWSMLCVIFLKVHCSLTHSFPWLIISRCPLLAIPFFWFICLFLSSVP